VTDLAFIHRFVPGARQGSDEGYARAPAAGGASPGSAASVPTLLLLHGTGGNESDLLGLGRELAPSANLLSPRGQVLEQGMPRFFRRLAMGVFDEDDLRRRAAELSAFVSSAAGHYGFDPSRVFAFGYSNGANIAAALLLLHPETLAGGVLLRPVLPLEPDRPPVLAHKPVLVMAGAQDPYSPRERVEALERQLADAGAAVDVRWREGGHGLEQEELETVRRWIEQQVC
jgi:phospholipase/carboxylesterase